MISIAERHKFIRESLDRNGYVKVQEIADRLGVTGATIRKDLRILESQGVLYRTHGSASPVKPQVADVSIHEKSVQRTKEKQLIGRAALSLLKKDDAIILASGSTVTAFASLLPDEMLNVVTPSLGIAAMLHSLGNIKVFMLGGELYNNSFSVRGEYAVAGLRNISCSKLFIGCDGIDLSSGVTCATVEEARLTVEMMKAASQTVVLADSSKFGRRGFGKIGNIEDVDIIITDSGIPSSLREQLEEAGIQIIIGEEK